MRFVAVLSLLALAGCSSHKTQVSHDPHPDQNVVLASDGGSHCSAKKVEMASTEGKSCHGMKAEMASADGKSCAKKAEMASAAAHCAECPKKADGTCDHEAGAKAGRECCKAELAKTATP